MTTCITNRCSQGHTPCPTPGVCNGGTRTPPPTWPVTPNRDDTGCYPALPIQYAKAEQQRDSAETALAWVLAVLCLFAIVAALSAAAGYLTASA